MRYKPVKKPRRRNPAKRRSNAATTARRRTVTRREYAELVVRLGSLELQVQRNRAMLELHAQRIAQMQEQFGLHASAATSRAADIPVVAVLPPATVES